MSAPAFPASGAVWALIPPSTSMSKARARSARMRAAASNFGRTDLMNRWPPTPGFTVMRSSISMSGAMTSACARGECGLSATPAFAPSSWISPTVRCRCGQASAWTVMWFAPAFTNCPMYLSGDSIMRWQSNGSFVWGRSASTIRGPIGILGTKWPSMMSMWMRAAPPFSAASTAPPRPAQPAPRPSRDTPEGNIEGGADGVPVPRIRHEWRRALPVEAPPERSNSCAGLKLRRPAQGDAEALGELLLDAYRGTIDYEGEDLAAATGVVRDFFAGKEYPPHIAASVVAWRGPTPAAFCMIAEWQARSCLFF